MGYAKARRTVSREIRKENEFLLDYLDAKQRMNSVDTTASLSDPLRIAFLLVRSLVESSEEGLGILPLP